MASLSQHMRPAEIEAINELNEQASSINSLNNRLFLDEESILNLNNEVDSASTVHDVTAMTGITVNEGGYIRFGKLVFVDLKITTSAQTTGGSAVVTGLPIGTTSVSPVFACDDNGETVHLFYVMDDEICADTALEAGMIYYINGVYFTD